LIKGGRKKEGKEGNGRRKGEEEGKERKKYVQVIPECRIWREARGKR
jgi:hypothetical protein